MDDDDRVVLRPLFRLRDVGKRVEDHVVVGVETRGGSAIVREKMLNQLAQIEQLTARFGLAVCFGFKDRPVRGRASGRLRFVGTRTCDQGPIRRPEALIGVVLSKEVLIERKEPLPSM